MLSEEYQLVLVDPTKWGWLSPISPTVYSQAFQDAVSHMERPAATLSSDVLTSHALPEPPAEWVTSIEQGWTDNVLKAQ
jgi:putative spermidine/putrescine transport system substrate-binding protein